jgi:hypothetical protein
VRPAIRRKVLTLSAATALLLALSTLPGCMIAVGDGEWDDGESWNEHHWGWASDANFSSSHTLNDIEARIAELEEHAKTCAHCCKPDKD